MSLDVTLARIAELQTMLAPRPPAASAAGFVGRIQAAQAGLGPGMAAASSTPAAAAPAAVAGSPVSAAMPAALALPPATGPAGTPAGQAVVALAQAEVGQAEQPPGSNNSPRIAQYRQATAGSGVGPWCAYFASWAAREAGVPLGDAGQGFGRVDDVWAWAQRAGKSIPAAGAVPRPGDLIVWDEHIGIVESVAADGSVRTVEGNSSDAVTRRTHDATGGGAIGYVRLG